MNLNLQYITNNFHDVRLCSLASWKRAAEISPRDHGGPYIVLQEGYHPDDIKMRADEFILGRSGKWLSLRHFFQLPIPERRAEFVFGTAAEVMTMMNELTGKVRTFGTPEIDDTGATIPENDEMAKAIQQAKQKVGA